MLKYRSKCWNRPKCWSIYRPKENQLCRVGTVVEGICAKPALLGVGEGGKQGC